MTDQKYHITFSDRAEKSHNHRNHGGTFFEVPGLIKEFNYIVFGP